MNTRITCLALLVSLAHALPARAQQVTNLPKGTQQSVSLETGFDSSFIARATYQHAVPGLLKDGAVYGRFTLPVVEPDLGDFAVDLGVSATAVGNDRWKIQLLLGPVLRQTSNLLFSASALGMRSGVLAGYRSDGWGLMAEVGYEQMFATHIHSSDRYRQTIYADARDGWYSITGNTLQLGLRGGGRIGRVEIFATLGATATAEFTPHTPPFYGTIGAAFAL